MSEVLVSISCITYNHSAYIRQCLDGMLMQQTTFGFEILIHDDCSTDGTDDIIREYVSKFPQIIKPLFEEENQYQQGKPIGTAVWNLPRAKGKYIAICEGDDYWTDPLKLQKQVDFLESHSEYGLVHTHRKIDMAGQLYETPLIDYKETKKTLLHSCSIATCTVMYTTEIFNLIQDEYARILRESNLPMSDYPLWLLIAEKSKIGYLPDATANYRMLPESASHSKSKEKMYNFDRGTMLCKRIFFNRFRQKGTIAIDTVRNFYEMEFHLRKRMLLNYGWIAREQIWPLLKILPYYPMIFYRSIIRKLKKN